MIVDNRNDTIERMIVWCAVLCRGVLVLGRRRVQITSE